LKVLVILNGISRKKKVFESTVRRHLEERFHAQIIETEYAGHAELLAAEGISAGFDIILSAGGDGTMHQVVNGVLTHESPTAAIGLIPLGSGNDLARSLGVTLDVRRIITQIEKVAVKEIDIGRASVRDSDGNHVTRYFVIECGAESK
jgi:diacylglycerol kinase (ATP)